jgi:molybdopterin-containing oxidoreductase family iron-sulfur binding subunit
MEKCSFCIQRIRRSSLDAAREGRELEDGQRSLNPACVNACPTQTLVFGDLNDPESRVSQMSERELREPLGPRPGGRGYHLLEHLGTNPSIVYLKRVDPEAEEVEAHG